MAADDILVAAASSLRTLWPDLIVQYQEDTGEPRPRVSFASSGLLSTQIQHGAPFDLFLSADTDSVARLKASELTRENHVVFALGKLILISHERSEIASELSLSSLSARLALLNQGSNKDGHDRFRITIPNPRHAPYGIAARAVLQFSGVWPVPAGHLLAAENAVQTLQFVNSGAIDVGIVPQALLTGESGQSVETGRLIQHHLPENSYEAVEHTMVRLTAPSAAADRLFDWLQSDSAKSILMDHGLSVPLYNDGS